MQITCDRSGVYESPHASTLSHPQQWLVDVLTDGRSSDTGISVNWKNAIGLSAAWYCVNTISGDVAQLPLGIYERKTDGTTEEDRKHPAGRLLRNPTEGDLGAFQFRYLMQNHALITGNGRAFIVRNGRGEPAAFVPLPAEYTQTATVYYEETQIRRKIHVVWPQNGGEPIPLPDHDVFHVFRFSWDGYNGVAPLELLKNSFGLGIAGDKYAARFYKQGGTPSFVLEAPAGVFREEAKAQEFLRKFNEYHSGLDNAQRVGLLREGIQARVLGINNRDAQIIEQRDFQVRDIMRVFGMPMVPGIADSQSYNTLEQLNRAYLLHCLGPWQRVWEEECARKLLTVPEQRKESYYFLFDSWELVKPDAAQRAEMLSKMVGSMIITPNEARDWEGLKPLPGGDKLINPATTNGGTAQNPNDTKPEPQPPTQEPNASRRQSIANRLRPLVNAEMRRVREMAAKPKFVTWCDKYYFDQKQRFAAVSKEIAAPEWMATDYCEQSKELILEAAGKSQPETLFKNVEAALADWPARADDLALQICEALQ